MYENGAACHWAGLKDRQDLQAVIRLLGQAEGRLRILDVGCGTGELLEALPSHLAKFGIDPSAAALQASRKGIAVLGASMDCIPLDARFDAITVTDVIEHLADPATLLDRAYALLSPGGLMILSTGDPGAKAWQCFSRNRFWYSSFPEHLSFPSWEFFATWAQKCGAGSVEKHLIRYRRLSPAGRLVGLLIQIIFMVSPGLLNAIGRFADSLRGAPHPRRRHFSPGVPGVFLDHQIVVIRKPANPPPDGPR